MDPLSRDLHQVSLLLDLLLFLALMSTQPSSHRELLWLCLSMRYFSLVFLVEKSLLYLQVPHGLSEPEFEEIMSRNRTVSSSAIARAVQVKHSHSVTFAKGFNTSNPPF